MKKFLILGILCLFFGNVFAKKGNGFYIYVNNKTNDTAYFSIMAATFAPEVRLFSANNVSVQPLSTSRFIVYVNNNVNLGIGVATYYRFDNIPLMIGRRGVIYENIRYENGSFVYDRSTPVNDTTNANVHNVANGINLGYRSLTFTIDYNCETKCKKEKK